MLNKTRNNLMLDAGEFHEPQPTHAELAVNDIIVIDGINPRKKFPDKEQHALTCNIRHNGLLQPLVVLAEDGMYTLIAGERRLRAVRELGYDTVPCRVYYDKDGLSVSLMRLSENEIRNGLTTLELASDLMKILKENPDKTDGDIAKLINIRQARLSCLKSILSLPQSVLEQIGNGFLNGGIAYEISRLCKILPPEMVVEFANCAIENGLNQKQIRDKVKALKEKINGGGATINGQLKHVINELRHRYGEIKLTVAHVENGDSYISSITLPNIKSKHEWDKLHELLLPDYVVPIDIEAEMHSDAVDLANFFGAEKNKQPLAMTHTNSGTKTMLLNIGDIVEHKAYGRGRVLGLQANLVHIAFENQAIEFPIGAFKKGFLWKVKSMDRERMVI